MSWQGTMSELMLGTQEAKSSYRNLKAFQRKSAGMKSNAHYNRFPRDVAGKDVYASGEANLD